MKFSSINLAVVALGGSALAYPALDLEDALEKRQDPAGHPWQIVQAGGVRGPCPGLNTLANHGYINRNGKDISLQQMQQGFLDAFGMGFQATQPGGQSAINLCSSLQNRQCDSFGLHQLSTPHVIEHDGSLSRLDKEMANNRNANNEQFNQGIWDRTLAIYGSTPRIGVKFANTARLKRVQQAQGADFPGWFKESQGASLFEHAFTLSTMHDPTDGRSLDNNPQARMDWINYWFTHQRLPTALGWKRPANTVTLNQIQNLANQIKNAGTVTADVGTSPFIRKRDLASAPQPSYNMGIFNPAKVFGKRGAPVPLVRVPEIVQTNPSRVQAAAAQASAQSGPAPELPNFYETVISPEQFTSYTNQSQAYEAEFNGHLSQNLGNIPAAA